MCVVIKEWREKVGFITTKINEPQMSYLVGTMVTEWFRKNDISCSGEKTKLLMLGTRANRINKIVKQNIHPCIDVCWDCIEETTSEKILGVVVNNTITCKDHLYEDNEGLIPGLTKCIGMLKKIKSLYPVINSVRSRRACSRAS